MDYRDYYKVLGVARDAAEKDIRAAYRKLARQYHPDVNPGNADAESRFKEINEAYQVLSDPEKRQKYDRFGRDWERYQQTAATGRQEPDFARWYTGDPSRVRVEREASDGGGFSDFFRVLFGNQSGPRGAAPSASRVRTERGADMEQEVEVSLEEAFHGATRTLQFDSQTDCPECGGVGIQQSRLCETCRGRGVVADRRRLEVRIPPGVYDGARVRLAGKGSPGVGGAPAGDLYLRVRLAPQSTFEQQGADVHARVPSDLYTLLLGGEVEVPTPSGRKVALTVPPGTDNGKVFRLRGQGMPVLGNPSKRGDLYVAVEARLPNGLSDREKELFRELREIRANDRAPAGGR
jgi:molecular chaperone DnaJ/curved DNA-binding protein